MATLFYSKVAAKRFFLFLQLQRLTQERSEPQSNPRTSLTSTVLTLCIHASMLQAMSKAHTSSSATLDAETVAVVERPTPADTKGSINLRIEANTRKLIDDAAAILGKTRTEFMIESARRQAIDVLLDQRLFALDSERFDGFMFMLDNPPAPGPKLRSLLRRVPAWQK